MYLYIAYRLHWQYKEWIINCSSCLASVWKPIFFFLAVLAIFFLRSVISMTDSWGQYYKISTPTRGKKQSLQVQSYLLLLTPTRNITQS